MTYEKKKRAYLKTAEYLYNVTIEKKTKYHHIKRGKLTISKGHVTHDDAYNHIQTILV